MSIPGQAHCRSACPAPPPQGSAHLPPPPPPLCHPKNITKFYHSFQGLVLPVKIQLLAHVVAACCY